MRNLTAAEVPQLSDEELREELNARGDDIGPISELIRPCLERMLLRKLGLLSQEEETSEGISNQSDGWKSQAVESNMEVDPDDPSPRHLFFGVYYPEENTVPEERKAVFTNKAECLAALKSCKGSRFKMFCSYDAALHFSLHGPEPLNQSAVNGSESLAPGGNSSAEAKAPPMTSAENVTKNFAYKSVTSQERVKFRKSIEENNMAYFKECLENPRYISNNGDNPTILKEGTRWNAAHVCCLFKRPEMLKMVLDYCSDKDGLIATMFSVDDLAATERRLAYLLGLYLNMPEKGLFETPLHCASKKGSVECVKVLTSYPQCKREAVNRWHKSVLDVCCDKVNLEEDKKKEIKSLIGNLLLPHYYVPVLRDPTYTLPPIVGEIWSPDDVNASTQDFADNLHNTSLGHLNGSLIERSMNESQHSVDNFSFSRFNSPISCSRRVDALIGPVPLSTAREIRQKWRENSRKPSPLTPVKSDLLSSLPPTPSTQALSNIDENDLNNSLALPAIKFECSTPNKYSTPIKPSQNGSIVQCSTPVHRKIAHTDYQKGLEVVGRSIAKEYSTDWTEYWDFLEDFVDLSSKIGKKRLERHLKNTFRVVEGKMKSRLNAEELRSKLTKLEDSRSELSENETVEKGEENSEREEKPPSDISALCKGLEAIQLNDSLTPLDTNYSPLSKRRHKHLENVLKNRKDLSLVVANGTDLSNLSNSEMNRSIRTSNWGLLSYVAQSCKVTAVNLSGVFEDLAFDFQSKPVSQLALVRYVKSRVIGEAVALHVIVNKCCAVEDEKQMKSLLDCSSQTSKSFSLKNSINKQPNMNRTRTPLNETQLTNGSLNNSSFVLSEREAENLQNSISTHGINFIHGLVAVNTFSLLVEKLNSAHMLFISEKIKLITDNFSYLEIASSDEEDDTEGGGTNNRYTHNNNNNNNKNTKRSTQHLECILTMLSNAFKYSMERGQSENGLQVPGLTSLGECHCDWGNCSSTLTILSQIVSSMQKDNLKTSNLNQSSSTKYAGAHSFFSKVLFGDAPQVSKVTNANEAIEDEEEEDADSFETAASTPDESQLATPTETLEFFIRGEVPSKIDLDVMKAIHVPESQHEISEESMDATVDTELIDETKYPFIAMWQTGIQEKQRSLETQTTTNLMVTSSASNGKAKANSMFGSPYVLKPHRVLSLSSSSCIPLVKRDIFD